MIPSLISDISQGLKVGQSARSAGWDWTTWSNFEISPALNRTLDYSPPEALPNLSASRRLHIENSQPVVGSPLIPTLLIWFLLYSFSWLTSIRSSKYHFPAVVLSTVTTVFPDVYNRLLWIMNYTPWLISGSLLSRYTAVWISQREFTRRSVLNGAVDFQTIRIRQRFPTGDSPSVFAR